ncbi:aminotransferase class I/II-fold pyridoxal phosphate-dependent enzyme [Marinilongibacter aquaticus]|uniref:trans-sulfuration enzyme family protein n=1 Tax=Marinilongibacter aquaticus TaxID=2975157 RepID=UPI0021BD7F32|nr:aminotransferase class I/II-fold pyridoxal phosphate-dependent enzyme [Marinilongibacter aquaticus]UBM59791.1 aminotransferase class I/II-fold pyridoxal phosphate-dependent enzyme [Marinilongibacter aquaticus]
MKETTKAIRIQTDRTQHGEHATPIFMTSSFTFQDAAEGQALFNNEIEGNIYARYSNPSVQEFIDKVCMLENMEAGFATASGMAAVFAGFAAHLQQGDHLVACQALFGSAHQIITQILTKWGISHTYLPSSATEEEWDAAVQENTKMVYLETPSNPGLEIVDLEMIGRIAKKHNLIYYVDNCFATPVIQKPGQFGANLIVHSATKFMDGQGRVLGGLICGTKELMEPVVFFCRHTGPAMSAFNAWILSKSLETLHLRMERHCSNAEKLAAALEGVEGVLKVNYPFSDSHPQSALAKKQMSSGGALVTFELDGGFERIVRFTQLLKIPSKTSNLGDSRTTITNPNTTTHSKVAPEIKADLGITEGLMRVSVGLEDIEDLIEDFKQAILGSK